jgi:hypothetical protein
VGLPGSAAPARAAHTDVAFGPDIRLRGYSQALDGDTVSVTLYWSARARPTDDATVFVQVTSPEGEPLGQYDAQPHGGLGRTVTWQPGEIVGETIKVRLARTVTRAVTRVGMYRTLDHRPLPTSAGRDSYLLGSVGPVDYAGPAARFDDGIALRGFRLDRSAAGGDAPATLTLIWSAERGPSRAYQVFVHVVDASGRLVAQADGPPEQGQRSTDEWPIGDAVVDTRLLRLPPGTGSGRLVVGLYDLATGARLSTGTGDSVELATLSW